MEEFAPEVYRQPMFHSVEQTLANMAARTADRLPGKRFLSGPPQTAAAWITSPLRGRGGRGGWSWRSLIAGPRTLRYPSGYASHIDRQLPGTSTRTNVGVPLASSYELCSQPDRKTSLPTTNASSCLYLSPV